ncbi:MAG: carbohydrate kinase family protein [Candidatus Bathyarchaeota archaeon]|nr:carbohydrate kinase family protein [Candidatus Bathyarchaeota archaeon]
MSPQKPDLAVVGHFSNDTLKLPKRPNPYVALGGSAAYTSIAAKWLGASVSVISKVGSDFPETYIRQMLNEGMDLSWVIKEQNERTTSFELTYNQDLSSRTLKLRNKGASIRLNELPKAFHAKAIHIAPIAAEIPPEVITHLRDVTDCLSLDPQGMTRNFDQEGNVTFCQMDKQVLPLIDICKVSFDELPGFTCKKDVKSAVKAIHDFGPEIVIVTRGAQGAVLSAQGIIQRVPAYESAQVVDPTGAGDAFIGAFLAEHIQKKELFWSACVGSAAASLTVESVGTKIHGEKEEIYQRANVIYEKEIKP